MSAKKTPAIHHDHAYWTIINDEPLDEKMGTTTLGDETSKEKPGEIYLIGRSAHGTFDNLRGPLTKKQYRALSQAEKDALPPGCER